MNGKKTFLCYWAVILSGFIALFLYLSSNPYYLLIEYYYISFAAPILLIASNAVAVAVKAKAKFIALWNLVSVISIFCSLAFWLLDGMEQINKDDTYIRIVENYPTVIALTLAGHIVLVIVFFIRYILKRQHSIESV